MATIGHSRSPGEPEPAGPPEISVVIPTWNRAELVGRAVASVLRQTEADFEVVVVDDGSSDNTLAVLRGICDPRLKVEVQRNAGVSAARNTGVRAATGKFVTFLDSDDEADTGWLEALRAPFSDPATDVALCGCRFAEPDGRKTFSLPPDGPSPLGADQVASRFLAGCWMVRRDLLVDSGGFDIAIRYGENTEVAIRLFSRQPSLQIVPVARPLVTVTRRIQPPDRVAQAEGAEAVVQRYSSQRQIFPVTWASYHTILGAERARDRDYRSARRHFFEAFRTDPRGNRRLARLFLSLSPVVARRVWGPQRGPRTAGR